MRLAEQDVLGAQVAVAVAHAPGRARVGELGPEARRARRGRSARAPRAGAAGAPGRGERGERLVDDSREPVVPRRLDGRGGVEAGDGRADGGEVGRGTAPRASRAARVADSS